MVSPRSILLSLAVIVAIGARNGQSQFLDPNLLETLDGKACIRVDMMMIGFTSAGTTVLLSHHPHAERSLRLEIYSHGS